MQTSQTTLSLHCSSLPWGPPCSKGDTYLGACLFLPLIHETLTSTFHTHTGASCGCVMWEWMFNRYLLLLREFLSILYTYESFDYYYYTRPFSCQVDNIFWAYSSPDTYVTCMLHCNKNILATNIIKDYFERFSVANWQDVEFRASNHRSISGFLSGIVGWRLIHRLLGHPLCLLSIVLEKLDLKYLQATEPRTNLEWTNEMGNIFGAVNLAMITTKYGIGRRKGTVRRGGLQKEWDKVPGLHLSTSTDMGSVNFLDTQPPLFLPALRFTLLTRRGSSQRLPLSPLVHLTLTSAFLFHTGASYTCLISEWMLNR